MKVRSNLFSAVVFAGAAALAFGATVSFSGCGGGSKCSASSCNGCCDTSGNCQTGGDTGACGAGGSACQPCGSGQTCNQGTCQAGTSDGGGGNPDGGPASCGGDHVTFNPFDAGGISCAPGNTLTIPQVRAFLEGNCPAPPNNAVVIENLVVTKSTISQSTAHTSGIPNDAGTKVDFWAVDAANPHNGIWIEKFTTDWATDATSNTDYVYSPTPGDNINVSGFAYVRQPSVFASAEQSWRVTIADQFAVTGMNPSAAMVITVNSTGAPLADNVVSSGFGNAKGGTTQANPEYLGARVHIPGPLTITNAYPAALSLFKSNSFPPATSGGFAGYEVGSPGGNGPFAGILVEDDKTYKNCDYGSRARTDGGVLWPNGISGVWDTYAAQPCSAPLPPDAGGFCTNTSGEIMFSDGCFATGYVNVLWPIDCADIPDGGL